MSGVYNKSGIKAEASRPLHLTYPSSLEHTAMYTGRGQGKQGASGVRLLSTLRPDPLSGRRRPDPSSSYTKLQDITMEPEDLSFQFIREITDNFSDECILGEGAFGVVYKGVTKDGHNVAVKKLKPSYADLDNKQFRNELHSLMKLNHQNIVHVLGYCYETEEIPFNMPDGSKIFVDKIHTALCFDYLHNGSLEKHLSDECFDVKLDQHKRFKIIKGICEGLKYMHKDLEKPIYHLDLKPDNILLDKDMVPKIADLGLSKIFGQGVTWTTHNAYGTLGYQPPEYINRGEITGKFDIFSLGIIIIWIVTKPGSYPQCLHMPSDKFIDQNNSIEMRNFLVQARDGLSSNLVLLCDANNTDVLNISQLENVKSTEEAIKIKLMGKQKITQLSFDWTQDVKRCVKDAKVLEYLVPPNTLRKLYVGGYSSKILPYWFMGIVHYLPNLISIKMMDMPKCISLPPLGQLQNLKELVIRGMDRITDIDESFYGGPRAFPQLSKFELGCMRDLQVWKTMYSFEDALEELMFPNLEYLTIDNCPMLRLIPCPPRVLNWKIEKSDNVLSSLREGTPPEIMEHLTVLKSLSLSRCEKTTLPHWMVELTSLQALEITDCPKLNSLQETMQHLTSLQALALRNCPNISVLPDWLGNLVALKEFVIQNCRGIKYLPESIGRLTELEELKIIECPDLDQWCQLDEKMMKLIGHTETKKKKDHYTSEDQSIDSRMQNTASEPLYLKLQNFLMQKEKDHYTSEDQSTDSKIQNTTSEPLYLTYTQLQKITNGFSRKVGEGAHGEVYRGLLENEEIAVKMLRSDMTQLKDNQFLNELENLRRLEHHNILRLVGYCDERRHIFADFDGTRVFAEQRYRAVCLEYQQNGSLRNHLRDEFNGLDWPTRYKIIKGTCEGLKYLWKGIEKPVYHLDLKPDNILLDKHMEPKLADFGLSRMFRGDLTCITQSPVGTRGYLPPEYIDENIISNKLDIYSLGVVMIETIAGPDGRSKSFEMSHKEFIDRVCGNWRRRLQETCDGSLRKIEIYWEQVKRCTQISLDCIEKDRNNRPSIMDVIDRLNEVEDLLNN